MKQFNHEQIGKVLKVGAQNLGIALSAVQLEKLISYLQLLDKWNGVYNLTAVRDPLQMATQHVVDSLSAVHAFVGAKNVLDVGAGGGLPGMVLAIWAQEANPEMRVAMIDTVHKKTAFLTQVKAELDLRNVTIHTARVEKLQTPEKFDVITSRAFAELADFVNWSGHLLAANGHFIAMKGISPEDELDQLPAGWQVQQIEKLDVPGMNAERHLIYIERSSAQSSN
jgi:16S rRNA (guanine527-N7)-methyltransferase